MTGAGRPLAGIEVERPEDDVARGHDDVAHGESSHFVRIDRGERPVVVDLAGADMAFAELNGAAAPFRPPHPRRVTVDWLSEPAGAVPALVRHSASPGG